MEDQQEIGGAQALLQLGSKTRSDDEHEGKNGEGDQSLNISNNEIKFKDMDDGDGVNGEEGNADGVESDPELVDVKTTNQQINDAVEAAVMRYVGGTLDGTGENGSNNGSRKNKRKLNHDDIMSNINEFNQWTGFLDDDITDNQAEEFNSFAQHQPQPHAQQPTSNKNLRKKKKKNNQVAQTHNEIDPELTGLDSSAEHDQLVQAAIIDARELAKQLGNGSLHDNDTSAVHNSLNNLPPHQAQQVIAAATAAVQQGQPNPESIAAINQLAQAASSLSGDLNRNNKNIPKQRKLSKIEDGIINYQAIKPTSNYRKPKFNHLTSIDSLVEEASAQACNWYNNLPQTNSSGPRIFSPEEISAVDHFITGYCHLHKLSRQDICNRIWSNERKKDNFWESLTRVLPYRSRASVYKHVRRQYHVFDVRAKWTKEDDELLRKLASTKEGNWKEIGDNMGRMPEDCRDRWRNYVKCGENRVLNKWSEEEERKLRDIVTDMVAHIGDDNKLKAPTINWTIVSERMNGVRSRIQCRYKWNKLVKRASAARASYMNQNTRLWLFQRLQRLGFPTLESVDWDYIIHLYNEERKNSANLENKKNEPDETWVAADFKVGFEKMKSEIKDHRKMSLGEVLERLIEDFYIRQGQAPPRTQNQEHHQPPQHQQHVQLPLHDSSDTVHYNSTARQVPNLGHVHDEEDDATSIANAAVAAVSASVNGDDTQQQEYSLWR